MKVQFKGMLLAAAFLLTVTVGCGKKEEPSSAPVPVQQEEMQAAAKPKEEKPAEGFPVPIHADGKVVSINQLDEAQKASVQFAYDIFHTEGIKTENELFEKIKNKYYIQFFPDKKIPKELDKPEQLIADYGSDMLPRYEPNRIVKSIVVMPGVPQGLLVCVPMYIELAGRENLHGVAIVYDTNEKHANGADKNFPVPNIDY
ncbi:hypothetical protein [Aneurinibacillus aneurinilyticus]|nr:hypothetical protein [Aneurinibacillus aneurinilyticus]MED0706837.1 hypothetical protein [Aneurinibacillus aneurinilyticus]MED0725912.1 hypothetical protein [Aneurinibacillus aneurinilyticus]MED0730377.1 hypothetical protein [Aneurinibacillus aneurinilyticus]MED0739206.1 hypothetical protein [Aneurinibacillus aneurinilyticus]